MKESITCNQFVDRFKEMNRENNFSYEGKLALFEYIEQYEEDCDQEIEFDLIALCCEYTEYEDLKEFHGNYDKETYPDLETLRDHTQVIEIEGKEGFIILDF